MNLILIMKERNIILKKIKIKYFFNNKYNNNNKSKLKINIKIIHIIIDKNNIKILKLKN